MRMMIGAGTMRIWMDALTSKQGTLFASLAKNFIKLGHEVLLTCREYEYTVASIERLGVEAVVVGSYSEGDPYDKVLADAERIAELTRLTRRFRPDILIAYPNPPAARVAFGTGVSYVALTDSPHAIIPSRLSLPLADAVLASEAIPALELKRFMYSDALLRQYRGVDELFWILRSRPSKESVSGLGLRPGDYVILRPHEEKATYYRGIDVGINIVRLAKGINDLGYSIVFLPRYGSHLRLLEALERVGVRVQVINGGYDGVSLDYYAAAVVSGGSTLAREAALLGTLGITYYPGRIYVNDYVASKGYPLFKCGSEDEILALIREKGGLNRGRAFEDVVRRLRRDFDDPLSHLLDLLRRVLPY